MDLDGEPDDPFGQRVVLDRRHMLFPQRLVASLLVSRRAPRNAMKEVVRDRARHVLLPQCLTASLLIFSPAPFRAMAKPDFRSVPVGPSRATWCAGRRRNCARSAG